MNAKIYGLDSSLIHDADPKDGFVVDMVRADAYLALEQERDRLQEQVKALAEKGLELASEAAVVYVKYNETQMPDRDLVDMQTQQEFHDLAALLRAKPAEAGDE